MLTYLIKSEIFIWLLESKLNMIYIIFTDFIHSGRNLNRDKTHLTSQPKILNLYVNIHKLLFNELYRYWPFTNHTPYIIYIVSFILDIPDIPDILDTLFIPDIVDISDISLIYLISLISLVFLISLISLISLRSSDIVDMPLIWL